MKKLVMLVIAGFMWSFMTPLLLQAQMNEMMWFLVQEDKVTPENLTRYKNIYKEDLNLIKKYQFDVPTFVYQNDENSFYWVSPIRNFASMDTMMGKWMQIEARLKEDGLWKEGRYKDLYTGSQMFMAWTPDLSYHPSDAFGQKMDKRYIEWNFYYLKMEHQKEASEALKSFIQYFKEQKVDVSWDTFILLLGNDLPAMIVMTSAESPVAMRTMMNNVFENHRDRYNKFWADFSVHLRKIENKNGWFLPDLSLLPGLVINEQDR